MDNQSSRQVLEVSQLRVLYGKRVAVDNVTLSVAKGEIVAMLGPNGAGKSTALMAMAGAILPNQGDIRVDGVRLQGDSLAAKQKIGFADQPPSLYEFFTVAEHVAFVAETRGNKDLDQQAQLLDQLGLSAVADRMCRELSFGMRQRVGLAAALVGDVQIVLLDETLNGLDPLAAKLAREVLSQRAQDGVAVLMSTHLLGVAERLCQRIVVMDAGALQADVAGDALDDLLGKGPGALEDLYLSCVASSSQKQPVQEGT